jgi:hypothetical protein
MPDVMPNIDNPHMPDTDSNRIDVLKAQYILLTTTASTPFVMTLQMLLVAIHTLIVANPNEIPTNILITSVSSFV